MPALFGDVDKHVAVLLGDLYVRVVGLDGYKFAVLGVFQGREKGAAINAVHLRVVDGDFAVVEAVLIDGGKHFFGEFERNVHLNGFAFVVRTDDADVKPFFIAGRSLS